MEITTNIYLTIVALLTTNLLIKCEGDRDNGIGHELQPIEPFSDHLDYLDVSDEFNDDVQSNNHGPMEQYQINALQRSDSGDPVLNNNFNKVIQRVEVIHHDGDSVTKYETTSHTNNEESDELFDDSLISSLKSTTAPSAYTKIVKKTVIKKNQNGVKNLQESSQPVEIMYSNDKSKGVDNSVSKAQSTFKIGRMENVGTPTSSQQQIDLSDNLKNAVKTKVINTSANYSKSNEFNGSAKRKYNRSPMPSNKIISATSSSSPNYYGGTLGSLQTYPIGRDDTTKITSNTKIIDKNGSNGRPLKRISRKMGNTLEGEKTIITKYQNIDDDYSDLDQSNIDLNTEKIRSSNNIISTSSSSNANYNGGETDFVQSYPTREDGEIKTIYRTKLIDKNGYNGGPIRKISRKPENSFKGSKTIITKYQDYDNDDSDLDDYYIDRNRERMTSATTGIIKKNNSNDRNHRQRTSLKPENSFNDEKTTVTKYQDIYDDFSDLDELDIDLNTENIRSSTTKMAEKNSSNGNRRQRTSLKPESSFMGEKSIAIKYQDIDDDHSDLFEHDIDHNKERIGPSNNILTSTSSSNSNYYNGDIGSSQSYPMGKYGDISTISTPEINGENGSNGKHVQRISRKPESSLKSKKTIITNDQGDDIDLNSSDEHSIDFNFENTRSSNNIVSKLNPSGYNKIVTTITTDRDNANNDLSESSIIPQINYDLTYSSPEINQKESDNLGSSVKTQSKITKQQGSSNESNRYDSNDHIIEYNMVDGMASKNSNTNSNYMIPSFDNNNGNYMSYKMKPSGASMSGNYESSMKMNESNKNGSSLRKKKRKSNHKKKVRGGMSNIMRSKNKSYMIMNGNGKIRESTRNMAHNSRSSRQQLGSQSSRSSVEMKAPKFSPFSQYYSYGLPRHHEMHGPCNCNSVRKLNKRQSSESNGNNYTKDVYDSKSLPVKNYLDMYNSGDKIMGFPSPFEAPHENSHALPLLPPMPPLSLLRQVIPPPPPPAPFATHPLRSQKPPGPSGPPGPPGFRMNPFDSFGPSRGVHLSPPPYPYSSLQHFSSSSPVAMNLEKMSFPLPHEMDVLSGQEKQVEVAAESIIMQQDNDVNDFKIEGNCTLNSESVTASTQSNVVNNTYNGPVIEHTKTAKTTENIGENGIPEVRVVETQVETYNDFTKAIV